MTGDRINKNMLEWYVMKCRKAADITTNIDAYNNNPAIAGQDRIDNYFIPATAIHRKTVTKPLSGERQTAHDRLKLDAALKSNSIRNTLRSFVFLHIRPSGLAALSDQKWNRLDKRLYHYRDYDGEEVTVSQKMMDRFIDACMEFGSKLEICTVQQTLSNGVKVTVREGAFAGMEAVVTNLQYKAEGIRFTIAIQLFAKGSYAYVHDRTPEDVMVSDNESYVFNSDFLDRIEDNLLTILKRRIKHKESLEDRERNDEQIREYYRLHNASMVDSDMAIKFDALMSICASLLKNDTVKTRYAKALKRRMKELSRTDTGYKNAPKCHAYLLSALFLSTKDPSYRAKLKEVVQTHLSTDDLMRRYVTILRLL